MSAVTSIGSVVILPTIHHWGKQRKIEAMLIRVALLYRFRIRRVDLRQQGFSTHNHVTFGVGWVINTSAHAQGLLALHHALMNDHSLLGFRFGNSQTASVACSSNYMFHAVGANDEDEETHGRIKLSVGSPL